tara:strand:+ start:3554 stop:5350 length:1797 start_codon:yes stop_codon:yes gene_type:complete
MKNLTIILLVLLSITIVPLYNLYGQKNFILPEPQKIVFPESEKDGFRLSKKTSLTVNGVDISKHYIQDFLEFIDNETNFKISTDKKNKKSNIQLVIESDVNDLGKEGYKISVLPNQDLKVESNTENGLFYGIQTLKQIIYFTKKKRDNINFNDFDEDVQSQEISKSNELPLNEFNSTNLTTKGYKNINETAHFYGREEVQTKQIDIYKIRPIIIEDYPRFAYRGMMLDVSRHFMPVKFIKKFIDIIAMHKMNKFHWHLTDDQGWRIEIKKYPKLTEIGSIRSETLKGHYRFAGNNPKYDGIPHQGFYTQEEIKEIVQYASERYIEIIPEVDMPGHTSALIASYPEFGTSKKKVEVKRIWGVHEEILKPTEKTFSFIKDLIMELKVMFPSEYFHIGGDEAKKTQWENSSEIQELMKNLGIEDVDSLQSYFTGRVERILSENGKKLIGWDEIIEGGLNENAIVMSWRGEEGGITAVKAGNKAIMTPTSHMYFDYYQAKKDEPIAIGGLIDLEKVYSYEPVPDGVDLNEASRIMGAQGNIWTEYIKTPDKVEYMGIPRMTALSEIVWSKRKSRDYDEFIKRLNFYKYFLDLKSINYREKSF